MCNFCNQRERWAEDTQILSTDEVMQSFVLHSELSENLNATKAVNHRRQDMITLTQIFHLYYMMTSVVY